MTTHRQHFVDFYSPGTFFAETSSRPIGSWDPKEAVLLGRSIVERYDATPYGFKFSTRIVADPIQDGEGGTLDVQSKDVEQSGMLFLGGKVETYDAIADRSDPRENILRSNMRCNGYPLVVVVERSYRTTHPFTEKDVIVDPETGAVILRGDAADFVEYRRKTLAAWAAEQGARNASQGVVVRQKPEEEPEAACGLISRGWGPEKKDT